MKRLRGIIAALFIASVLATFSLGVTNAATDKQLRHLKGSVGYQMTSAGPLTDVAGEIVLPDDAIAVTQDKAAALLTLPDSSIVSFGANTRVQVGAFNQTAQGPGSTITVQGGTLRFDIRRPTNGVANYRFVTPTSQIAVRGTVGLLSLVAGNTTVGCLACAADSVSVTVGTQTFALATGQVLTISATGAVVTGTLTGSVLSAFSGAGVSTSASTGMAAATAGVTGASAGIGTAAAAAGAAAAVGGAAAAISSTAKSTPAPTVTFPIEVQGRKK